MDRQETVDSPSATPAPGDKRAEVSPSFAVATQPSYGHALLFGSDGLRPGWGFTFYVAMFYALRWMVVEVPALHFGTGLWADMSAEFEMLVAAAVPAILLARVERRPWKYYGLPVHGAFGKLFWLGTIWGFAAISLLILVLYGLHDFSFGHLALHGVRVAKFAAFWAVMFLLVGLFEEFLLRGYSQFTLARGIGFWPAALALSVTFGLTHLGNGGEHWPGIVAAAWIGLFFCLTLRRTGSLWFAVGFHAAWDWGETFFYSVPDSGTVAPGHLLSSSLSGPDWLSGGSVGPEGSVLCFVIVGLAWVVFERGYREPAAVALPAKAGSSSLRSSE